MLEGPNFEGGQGLRLSSEAQSTSVHTPTMYKSYNGRCVEMREISQ